MYPRGPPTCTLRGQSGPSLRREQPHDRLPHRPAGVVHVAVRGAHHLRVAAEFEPGEYLTLISGTSTFLIVSKRAASSLHIEADDDSAPATPEVIADRLKDQLRPRVAAYGLEIDRVEIQEVQLPRQIQQAVDEVWVSSTRPAKSRYEAEAQRHRLEAVCASLGPQAAAAVEIVQKLPEGACIGNPLAAIQAIVAQLGVLATGTLPPPVPSLPSGAGGSGTPAG